MMKSDLASELTARWQGQVLDLSERVSSQVRAAWDALESYNEVDIRRMQRAMEDVFNRSYRGAVGSTDAYLSTLSSRAPIGVSVDDVLPIPPSARDAFTVTWKHLKDGALWRDAVAAGSSHVEAQAFEHMVEVSRQAAGQWSKSSGRQLRWQRLLRGASCEWCALVSTQSYHTAESANFGHDRCDCVVVPWVGETDIYGANVTNKALLRSLNEEGVGQRIGANRRADELLAQADNAQARAEEWRRKQLEVDSGGETYEIYGDRARSWNMRAKHDRARAAEMAARTPVKRQEGTTGYVNPDGSPAPRPAA